MTDWENSMGSSPIKEHEGGGGRTELNSWNRSEMTRLWLCRDSYAVSLGPGVTE